MPHRDAVYITKPERIIWPVIAFVALTLFAQAGKATVAHLRFAFGSHHAVASSLPAEDIAARQGESQEAIRPADAARLVARNGTRSVASDVRLLARRTARVTAPVARPVLRAEFVARSYRQRVVSPRPGALIIHFSTAPPAAALSRAVAGAA